MKINNVPSKSMFQELIDFLNERINCYTNSDEVSLHLFNQGYLVKNSDGSIYDVTVRHYLVKLKHVKCIEYNKLNKIKIINTIPKDLQCSKIY